MHQENLRPLKYQNITADPAGLTMNVPEFILITRGICMGMEDRDWYRDKQIDWDRGGLRQRNRTKQGFPKYVWWLLFAVLLIIAIALLRSF
jgi:hypothetical protein